MKKKLIHHSVSSLIIIALLSACQNNDTKSQINNAAVSVDGVKLIDERIGLSMGHKMMPEQKKIRVYYRQDDIRFCVDKRSLFYSDTMFVESMRGWRRNGSLIVSPEPVLLSEISGYLDTTKSYYDPENYNELAGESGHIDIDLAEYYENREKILKIIGKDNFKYAAVGLFPCDNFNKRHVRVTSNKTDYLVLPITYFIRFQ
jgi:hypothetical protein